MDEADDGIRKGEELGIGVGVWAEEVCGVVGVGSGLGFVAYLEYDPSSRNTQKRSGARAARATESPP